MMGSIMITMGANQWQEERLKIWTEVKEIDHLEQDREDESKLEIWSNTHNKRNLSRFKRLKGKQRTSGIAVGFRRRVDLNELVAKITTGVLQSLGSQTAMD